MSTIVPKHLNNARVLLIRHAKSHFNNDWPPGSSVFGKNRYGPQHFKFASSPEYLDCLLCEEGV